MSVRDKAKKNPEKKLRVIGIDLGTKVSGFGLLDFSAQKESYVASGVMKFPPQESMSKRLVKFEQDCMELLEHFSPQLIVVEVPFIGLNPKSTIHLSMFRAVVLLLAEKQQIELLELSPREIKMLFVGNGRASKQEIIMTARKHFGIPSLESPDEADALAIAFCGKKHLRKG